MPWRHKVRGAVLPALTIAAALLAGTGMTYAVVVHLAHPAAAPRARAGYRPLRQGLPARLPEPAPSAGAGDRTRWPSPASTPSARGSAGGPGPNPAPAPTRAPAPNPSPATSPVRPGRSEQAELAGLAAVLERSASSRALVMTATSGVASCTLAPRAGLADMDAAMTARQDQLMELLALPVSAIPDGSKLRAGLATALRMSLAADRQLAQWMDLAQPAAGCPLPLQARVDYQAGLRASALAAEAKRRFLQLWDPLAARAGLPEFTAKQI